MRASDFVYEKELGRVYRVRSKSDNKLYVIKEQTGRSTPKMVTNEIEILKKMRHPNIVAYYDSWREDNKGFILMEYASRGTLKQLLRSYNKPFPEEDALYLFAQIALGIHHIHKRWVLHRDLKPGNIMLHGSRGDIVKIGDFGIAKNVENGTARTFAGTEPYMAPEIFEGKIYDFSCDIWSAGIILYELLTNRYPFVTKNRLEMMEQINQGRLRRLPEGDLSSGTIELTYKMLRRDPSRRPRSGFLVLCPALLQPIMKVYLNVGRIEKAMILGTETFENYMEVGQKSIS
ncbi:serine/threonine-protein kinase Nek8-like isoform X2 [Venturia canescens]|uniref:serine/threonine-protein kinase Nek8-like isoform X2 n=1 Tax=Venturia canescens TaxID=32260 RepID=UPI001C9D54FF|nr:serine/threonine-protein kinase Nek8-like isoform X2 [Venturia canescens]